MAVVETATGRVVPGYRGFGKPRALAIAGPSEGSLLLFVVEGGPGRVQWRPLPGFPGLPLCGIDPVYLDAGGASPSAPPGAASAGIATDPTGRLAFLALDGAVGVLDLADPEAPPFRIPLPGVRTVFARTTR